MNLLPWREQVRKKKIQSLIIQWGILFFILISMLGIFMWQQQLLKERLKSTHRHIVVLKSQLSLAKSDAQHLRQNAVKQKKNYKLT